MSSFQNLPTELIESIFEHVQDHDDLRSLARTAARFQAFAEDILYREIFHRTGQEVTHIATAVQSRPDRAHSIQFIDSRCKWHRRDGLESLASVVEKAQNLRQCTVESPYCNHAYGTEAEKWRKVMYCLLRPICKVGGLPMLQDLTLHLTGAERYWLVDAELSPIFAHPSLASLTVSCADLHEDELQGLRQCSLSPLRQLTLTECNITLEALEILLAIPRALRELHLGENCNHQFLASPKFRARSLQGASRLCSTDVERFCLGLSLQKHSLETMSYSVRGPSKTHIELPASCKGFSEFVHLQHLMLDGHCPYFEKVVSTPTTGPPNLITLMAKGDMFRLRCAPGLSLMDDYQSQVGWTIATASNSKSLQSILIASSRTFTNISRNHREAVTQLGNTFKDQNVSMKLFKRTCLRNIPPFLYGEQVYKEELVYDSVDGFAKDFGSSGVREDDDIDF